MVKKQQIIVIKLGGTEGVNFESICKDTANLIEQGFQIVIVHGGSAEANALGEALGYPPRFVTSPSGFTSRYTDKQTLKIFTMAVAGKLNPNLVNLLHTFGINAIGLNGSDGNLIQAKRKSSIRIIENGKRKILHGDYTGTITNINVSLLQLLLSNDYTPVIAPLAISPDNETLNVDADRAAARVAGALKARTLMLFTGAPGLLRNFPDENSLISEISSTQLDDALTFAKGRMKKKVLGTKEAIVAGVKKVVIADGRIELPVIQALNGGGTHIQ